MTSLFEIYAIFKDEFFLDWSLLFLPESATTWVLIEKFFTLRKSKTTYSMLENLGLVVEIIYKPFNPEGGAYGDSRTTGHQH